MSTAKKATPKNKKNATTPQQDNLVVVAKQKNLDYPTLLPASQNAIAAWNNNVKIVSTWGIAENNNAWLNVSGLGFRRIKEANSQSLLALLMIGVHARDKNSVVNLRTEADNKIYEMYVW